MGLELLFLNSLQWVAPRLWTSFGVGLELLCLINLQCKIPQLWTSAELGLEPFFCLTSNG